MIFNEKFKFSFSTLVFFKVSIHLIHISSRDSSSRVNCCLVFFYWDYYLRSGGFREGAIFYKSSLKSALVRLRQMWLIKVMARVATKWFPYFLKDDLFFGSNWSRLLFSHLVVTGTYFKLGGKLIQFGENRENNNR